MARTISKERAELIRQILMELPCVISNGGYYVVKRSQLIAWLLGEYPTKNDIIHHKNENKLDDRPENLEVMTRAEHSRLHYPGKYEKGFNGKGRKHTEEWKRANGERMKGNQHVRGYRYTDEQKAKSSESKRRRYQDPEQRERTSKAVAEVWRKRREGLLPMPNRSTVH